MTTRRTTLPQRLAACLGWWLGIPDTPPDGHEPQGVIVTHETNKWGTAVRNRVDYRHLAAVIEGARGHHA